MPSPPALPSSPRSAPALRVALFTGNYNHIADGVSLTLNRLTAFLLRQGIEVLVFGPTVENPPVEHVGEFVAVPSLPAPGRPEYRISIGFGREARARLERFEPHLVHIATPDVLGYRALRWARRRGVPVVSSYHTHFASYLKYYGIAALEGLLWEYLRWFYRQCEHVYVPSHTMAAVLQSHEITKGLRLWERGVDMERFHPRHRDLAWRRELGVADDEVLVTFIGRLVWEKGLGVYADVVEGLAAQGLSARSLIVGEGPAREDLVARLGETRFVGHLEGQDLARAYASSDLFLFPSDTETFGNVTLEAMASGLPTVCADAGGSSQLVQHQTSGFLAPPGRSDVFLDYTGALVTDAALRARMGAAARTRAEHYGWDAVLRRLLGYYRDVLAERTSEALPQPVPARIV